MRPRVRAVMSRAHWEYCPVKRTVRKSAVSEGKELAIPGRYNICLAGGWVLGLGRVILGKVVEIDRTTGPGQDVPQQQQMARRTRSEDERREEKKRR
jgi:hypothetical protein